MNKRRRLWALMRILIASATCGLISAVAVAQDAPAQMVRVITADWDTFHGELQRFEKNSRGEWVATGDAFSVQIGKKGLGWGRGLHGNGAPDGFDGPIKREGDGKAPAGVFRLGTAFGYADGPVNAQYPYVQATSKLRCVDDIASQFYNLLVDESLVSRDWNSDEAMLRNDYLYRLGIVVEHNTSPVFPGGGSCIFLHLWRENGVGTAGCTAMSEDRMQELQRWLDPSKYPVLVQLPVEMYVKARDLWSLP